MGRTANLNPTSGREFQPAVRQYLLEVERGTCFDGGREWLIRKSEMDDFERGEEFEKAADAAEKTV